MLCHHRHCATHLIPATHSSAVAVAATQHTKVVREMLSAAQAELAKHPDNEELLCRVELLEGDWRTKSTVGETAHDLVPECSPMGSSKAWPKRCQCSALCVRFSPLLCVPCAGIPETPDDMKPVYAFLFTALQCQCLVALYPQAPFGAVVPACHCHRVISSLTRHYFRFTHTTHTKKNSIIPTLTLCLL